MNNYIGIYSEDNSYFPTKVPNKSNDKEDLNKSNDREGIPNIFQEQVSGKIHEKKSVFTGGGLISYRSHITL